MNVSDLQSDWIAHGRAELLRAAAQWLQDTVSALEQAQNRADSLVFANRLFHVQRALERMRGTIPERLVGLLAASMDERRGPETPPARRPTAFSQMELVDDDVVNESIAISKVTTHLLAEAGWEIRLTEQALAARAGTGGDTVKQRSNPFHPEAFGRAVWKLAEDLGLHTEERAACLKVSADATAGFAQVAYANLSAWLRSHAPAAPIAIRRGAGLLDAIPVDVFAGVHEGGLDFDMGPVNRVEGEAPNGKPLVARDKVFAHLIQSIEAVLADARLTPELRRVLSGLQMVALRFGLGVPSSLYAAEHRMWQLGTELSKYALTHCLKNRVAHDDFVLFADLSIQQLLQQPVDSLTALEKGLERIHTYLRDRPAQLADSEQQVAQHFARREDRRRRILGAAINRHRERISAAIAQADIPYRLRQFLLVDWAEVLAQTEVAEGPKSPDSLAFWAAVDRMAAAAQPDAVSTDGRDLEQRSELLRLLERGVACIAVPSVERYELAALLDRTGMIARDDWADSDIGALDRAGAAADAPAASTDSPRRRDFWGAPEPREAWAQTLNSTAAYSTAMPASDAEQCVNVLRVGASIELFLVGAWIEVRLTRLADEGRIFQFEGDSDGSAHQLTRRALLRLFREGLAVPL